MKRTPTIVAVTLAAGIAGWFSVSPPEEKRRSIVPLPAAAAPVLLIPAQEPLGVAAPGLAALENDLLRALQPATGTFSGERLAELCLQNTADDLPGPSAPSSYATDWAKQDPQGMFEWFRKHGGFRLPRHDGAHHLFLPNLFREWAKNDVEAAIRAAPLCPGRSERSAAFQEIVAAVLKKDPARALAIASEHSDFLAEPERLGFSFSASGKDYRDKWNLLASLPAGEARSKMLSRFFTDVARYHGSEVAGMWREMPSNIRQAVVAGGFTGSIIANDEGAPDTPAALEGLGDLLRARAAETGDARTWLSTPAAREWAQQDLTAALAWTQQNLKGRQRVEAAVQMFGSVAEKQFDSAVQQWQVLPEGILRARAAGQIAGFAPAGQKAAAEALLATLSPADRHLAAVEQKAAEQQIRLRQSAEEFRRLRPQG